jgi:hypothetical protein
MRNSLPDIIRVIESRKLKWAEHVAHIGDVRNLHKIFVWKPEWKRPLTIQRNGICMKIM